MTTPLRNLRCESHGDVRLVTIDRPEKKNALSNEMRSQLCELLADLDVDDSVRAVVLTGEDPVFTAGVDFTDIDPAFNARDAQFSVNPGRALRAIALEKRTAPCTGIARSTLGGNLPRSTARSGIPQFRHLHSCRLPAI